MSSRLRCLPPIAACLAAALGLATAPSAVAAPGDLDPAFGQGGIVTVPDAGAAEMALGGPASDRRIVIAGQVPGGLTAVRLASLRADGSVAWKKTVSGTQVPVVDPNLGTELRLEDVAMAADGRAALLARHGTGTWAIVVFRPDGALDPSFSGDGMLNVAGNGFGPARLAFQPDGRLVVAFSGSPLAFSAHPPGVRLHRFTTAGTPDGTFGTAGIAQAPPPPCCAEDPLQLIAGSASILVAGVRRTDTASGGAFLRRFTSAGALDPAVDERLEGVSLPVGLGVDSSGRFVLAQTVSVPADQRPHQVLQLRLTGDGAPDTSFGPSGVRSAELRAPGANVEVRTTAMAVTGNKVVVAGSVSPSSNELGTFVARLGADGALDPTFGPATASTNLQPHITAFDNVLIPEMAVQPDGRIVVAGSSAGGARVARLLAECFAFACSIQVQPAPGGALIETQLRQPFNVGILVRRRVGRRVVTVGRVPLGARPRGRNRIAWNLRVDGRRLAPGVYEVTLRALDRRGRVVDLSRPARLVVRAARARR